MVEKSYSFQNLPHKPPRPWKKIILGPPSASLCPAHSHLGQRKLASPTGTFVWGGGAGAVSGAGGRDEGRGAPAEQAGSGQSLHKGPSVCPSCPHADINKMCIYLFIYTSGLGQRLGAALSPQGQGAAEPAAAVAKT